MVNSRQCPACHAFLSTITQVHACPALFVQPAPTLDKGELQPIRSSVTRRLLAYRSEQGIVLWDRRSDIQHLLTWQELRGTMVETA